jgi:hypothetical protein
LNFILYTLVAIALFALPEAIAFGTAQRAIAAM